MTIKNTSSTCLRKWKKSEEYDYPIRCDSCGEDWSQKKQSGGGKSYGFIICPDCWKKLELERRDGVEDVCPRGTAWRDFASYWFKRLRKKRTPIPVESYNPSEGDLDVIES